MSFPEGPLLRKEVLLAGGQMGVEHACPDCGVGILRTDHEAEVQRLEFDLDVANKVAASHLEHARTLQTELQRYEAEKEANRAAAAKLRDEATELRERWDSIQPDLEQLQRYREALEGPVTDFLLGVTLTDARDRELRDRLARELDDLLPALTHNENKEPG